MEERNCGICTIGNNPVGRDHFEDIQHKYNLKLRKKKRKPWTNDSRHSLPINSNIAKTYRL